MTVRLPRRGPARPARAVLLAALAALPLAGCAGVPSSSPAQVANPMPANARPPERLTRSFVVVKPERGDSPAEIVRKFITAQGNPERSHGVARQFLTPHAAETWDDDASVRVVDSNPYYGSAADHVTMSVHQVGIVAANGGYSPTEATYSPRYHLVRIDGQWRIDKLDSGVVVNVRDFQNLYQPYSLYYLDQAEKHVIGDLRYFASTSTSSATSQATLFLRLLQQAPSSALGDAVRSELGGGVRLVGNVVQGRDKVLRVYLTGLGTKSSGPLGAAVAQIVWTLNQLAVSGVSIYDDGQLLDLHRFGVTQPTQQSDWQTFDPDALPVNTSAYYLRDGALYTADGHPVPGPAGQGEYKLSSIAVSLTSDASPTPRVAGVSTSDGQATLYVGQVNGPLAPRLRAHSLVSPTWDTVFDEAWTARDGRLVRVPRHGQPAPVNAQSLDTLGTVRMLRLSRDGTRVAIVAGPSARLYVARVTRDNGQVAVEDPVDVAPSLPGVDDIAWESASTVLVLARGQGDDRMLRSVSVDGERIRTETTSGLPLPPVSVAAAPNLPSIVVSNGTLWQRTGSGWSPLVRTKAVGGTEPTYPD